MKNSFLEMLPHILFALVAISVVCLTIALVGECKMGSRWPKKGQCVEFDLPEETLSSETPVGIKCETTQSGEKVHVTCCGR
jgi:hypothetical protein